MKEEKFMDKWQVQLGFYPGILLGIRTYKTIEDYDDFEMHETESTLYIPFFHISLVKFDTFTK